MDEKNQNNEQAETAIDLNGILQIRREKLKELRESGDDPFEITKFPKTHYASDIADRFESLENQTVTIAGRMISKRGMGKAAFCDIQDSGGKIQVYVRSDDVTPESYAKFKKFDIGDIVGITGFVFKTKMGEISVHAASVSLLSKSLRPLPEKWHGLRDTDLRYRQRYVDLIVNPEVRDTFIKRSRIISEMRTYLDALGFIEVETPVLNTIPGGAAARPFITHHNTLDIDMYLRIATELHLKRLIVGGFDKVYEIGRIFRNEGMSIKHNPEFTTIELYEAYKDYHDIMDLTENIISEVSQKVLGKTEISYQGQEISLSKPWRRVTMIDAVLQVTGVDFNMNGSDQQARDAAGAAGFEVSDHATWGEVLYKLFDEQVEQTLIQPVFIIDHPIEVSPLAKRKKEDKRLTERFELFITGREFANAFSELNDPVDQKARFSRQVELRDAGDEEASMMDDDFINALEYGMPPTGGLGIGIDRLVMLLTDSYSIRDVLLFPTMKPTI